MWWVFVVSALFAGGITWWGTYSTIGAAFAHMEMDVVLRTLLRDFVVEPTDAKSEAWHSRGVASAPRRGGQVTLHSRT